MVIESFGGINFCVTSVSNIVDDCESIEFVAEGGPSVAITTRDDDPARALRVSMEGEIEATAFLQMIAYSRRRLGLVDLPEEP
ncbi:hypothetical protein ACIA8G_40445 [Lentzea sp. NPDC051213]|uniref:hypothetical protein n=1 Tax=Lentzea sp. NPDC051213 TaxID=3364126 RepID=UPI00379E9D7A